MHIWVHSRKRIKDQRFLHFTLSNYLLWKFHLIRALWARSVEEEAVPRILQASHRVYHRLERPRDFWRTIQFPRPTLRYQDIVFKGIAQWLVEKSRFPCFFRHFVPYTMIEPFLKIKLKVKVDLSSFKMKSYIFVIVINWCSSRFLTK